jgi:hypothetical protein
VITAAAKTQNNNYMKPTPNISSYMTLKKGSQSSVSSPFMSHQKKAGYGNNEGKNVLT